MSDPARMVELLAARTDVNAEMAVLADILQHGSDRFHAAAAVGLRPEDFGVSKHQVLFRVMGDLAGAGTDTRMSNVAGDLNERGRLAHVDGLSGIAEIASKAQPGGIVGYARIVRRNAAHRRAFPLAEQVVEGIATGGSVDEICGRADEIQTVYRDLEPKQTRDTLEDCLAAVGGFDALLSPPARLVPFPWTDAPVNGFAPGQLVTVGGRSSMGKTVVACQTALYAAKNGNPTLFLSLEMGEAEIMRRFIAMVGRINHSDLQTGNLDARQRRAAVETFARINEWPLSVTTSPNTVEALSAKVAERRRNGRPYELVVVDYLGLLQTAARSDNRTAEVSHISRRLKLLAMENGVPVVALAQLNRAPDRREEHEPQLSDLRDSGSIEQDSDVVLFIHRPGYYRPNDPELRNVAQLIVRKQRNGPIGTIDLTFLPEFVTLSQPATEPRQCKLAS